MRQILWLLIILMLIAIVGLGFAAKLSTLGPDVIKYESEWVTALLQVGLIATIGAVTTLTLEILKSSLQRSKDQSNLKRDAYYELRQQYQAVKLIRRRFQVSKLFTPEEVASLNTIQLALEGLRDDSDLFARSAEICEELSKMETYLNHLANKEDSSERAHFHESKPPEQSFKQFSLPYSAASTAMRWEFAPPSIFIRWRLATIHRKRQ